MTVRAAALLACWLTLASAAVWTAPFQAQWRRLDTPNFVVIGDLPAATLRDIAGRFEGFREALGSYLGPRVTASIVPTIVLVFPSDGAFTPYKPRRDGRRVDATGVFLQGRHINYIAFAHADDENRDRVIMHELAHLVVSNSGQNVPVWLHEGLAEYYSTLAISTTGEHALVGRLIQTHLNRLRNTKLLTLEELLTITPQSPLYNEGSRQSVFYAQAWALAHMIHNGQPKRVDELNRYLERLAQGIPAIDAWKHAFGDADIMAELERYARRLQFTAFAFPLSGKVSEVAAPVVDVTRADVDAYLGQLRIQQEDLVDAEAKFASAQKREPDNVRARVGRALLDLERGDAAGSAARISGLAPPADWLLAYQTGMAMGELVDQGRLPPTSATFAAVRSMFAPAVSTGRLFPSIASTQGRVEMSGLGQPTKETRAAIERARAVAPGHAELQIVYAQLLIRAGELNAARDVLTPLDAPTQAPVVRDLARRLLGQVAARTARGAGLSVTSRVPVPGEQRTDGVLHTIACAANGEAAFHLNLTGPDGAPAAATFVAARLEDVQLVSHRDDFRGPVGCGALKEPMAVRISWLPGPEGSRRAVAIEFLAK